ncbi:FecR family protein [Chitinophaga arvensicola]|uniref:Ferric-dicitrate binding protein FerR, regulates iron transport through sigma-19 n=1 Tax=Chitinophaga arvensicola TaxID=29529 RepID=A0A1I0SB70_9BACT|nr:FecR family protein [Chitinophaga arvensicola]SEW53896.1 ferric-dicitrate binding protein FerR, regulates iron transport through sigma-19 [Chitinophaga arvensicola]
MKKRIRKYFNSQEPIPDKHREQELWNQLPNDAGQTDEFWQDTWNNIRRQRNRQTRIIRMKQLAVAATVTGLLLGAYYWFGVTHQVSHPPAVAAATSFKIIRNTTSDAMEVTLDDSSRVTLFPASTLRYETGFAPGKREVFLEGTALFNVEQAENKPFTVFSNNIATTVLGTTFKVTGTKETSYTSVYLYKGKVVVKSANPQQVKLSKDYFLQPGDVFHYDHQHGVAALDQPKHPVINTTHIANTTVAGVSNWYMFENQGLAEVLDQLAAIWNVPIHYNPADLQGLNFIGKIERTDTLVNVLNDIALLNNLRVVNNGKNYSIRKK